ncbi:Hypothetical protein NTJ_14952 [Nesidiocoris tenuis]|uniref:Ion transport domain-containing protein n=1 Tax=Nesidiocoris tenuis TaxID=355587 RepID=A0ABN7BCN2_9HEMI|nr:Hypothetical protein NTJ_14952 [Nesidiocoris tenuis]
MMLLDTILYTKIPSPRDAIRPIVKMIYELVGSILFTILFIVSIFRLLNHFRVALSEIFRTVNDVYKSVREIYEVFAALLHPLVFVWRFLVILSARTHGTRTKTI